jgi:hypothetical protein
MVLFRDDELRMIAAERAAEPRWKKRLRLFIKITLVVSVLFGISLFLLSTQGGNSEPLKRGLEEYLQQTTGYKADIGHLNYMAFYPIVGIDFDDLAFYSVVKKEVTDEKGQKKQALARDRRVADVGHVTLAIRFWDLFLSRHSLVALKITGIDIAPGIVDKRAVSIGSLMLDPKGLDDKPAVVIKGTYGKEAIAGAFEMRVKGRAYAMPDNAKFKMSAGPLEAAGTAAHRFGKGLVLNIDHVGAPSKLADGTLTLSLDGSTLNIDTELHVGDSVVKADVRHKAGHPLTGTIDVPILTAGDIRPLAVLMAALADRWPGAPGLDAQLSLADVPDGMTALGRGKAKIVADKGVVRLNDFSGHMVETLPSKDGRTMHVAADGLSLTLPRDPSVTCLALAVKADAKAMKIGPAAAGGGDALSYSGQGSIDLTGRQTVTLAFTPSAKPNKDCVLP